MTSSFQILLKQLQSKLPEEFKNKVKDTSPRKSLIYNAFNMEVEDVKVVILGQDPYPNVNIAMGKSFAVPTGARLPLSLREFLKEIDRTEYTEYLDKDNNIVKDKNLFKFDTTLSHWESQGILLLNKSLTTVPGESNSHKKEWALFTDSLIEYLSSKNPLIVWGLLGKDAQSIKPLLCENAFTVEWNHPAASRFGKPFLGSNFFMNIQNQVMQNFNEIITW